jgi:NADPH-dependent 2,4-dienoyl-CoA reductase/sulfur reductase-like enzyme
MRARIAVVMALVIGAGMAGTALADRDDHDHGRSEHEHHDRGWHGHRGHAFYSSEPDVYYAPPPIIYAPVYPSPAINLIFPFRIR